MRNELTVSEELFEQELFNGLMDLTREENSPFYFVDQICPYDNQTYRTFLYRLASWTDFQKPFALESRGTMFRLEKTNYESDFFGFIFNPVLVSRPFEKFFNMTEGSVEHNLEDIIRFDNKFDGSLIKTYLDYHGNVRLASKGSLVSEQAKVANELFEKFNSSRQKLIKNFLEDGCTILYEYTSPNNQIVIRYPTSELKLLAIRSNYYGDYFSSIYSEESLFPKNKEEADSIIQDAYNNESASFEGLVAVKKDGSRFKIKSHFYVNLHRMRDEISNLENVIKICLSEKIDDVISAFSGCTEIVDHLRLVEERTNYHFRKFLNYTDESYKELMLSTTDRKTFAMKAQKEYQDIFHFMMAKYVGKDFDTEKLFIHLYYEKIKSEINCVVEIE